VKKNGIMMVDFAIEPSAGSLCHLEMHIPGLSIRFRPIMMTTMAAIMGTLPIALGMGAARNRGALGMAVVGGLLVRKCSRCT